MFHDNRHGLVVYRKKPAELEDAGKREKFILDGAQFDILVLGSHWFPEILWQQARVGLVSFGKLS